MGFVFSVPLWLKKGERVVCSSLNYKNQGVVMGFVFSVPLWLKNQGGRVKGLCLDNLYYLNYH